MNDIYISEKNIFIKYAIFKLKMMQINKNIIFYLLIFIN